MNPTLLILTIVVWVVFPPLGHVMGHPGWFWLPAIILMVGLPAVFVYSIIKNDQ